MGKLRSKPDPRFIRDIVEYDEHGEADFGAHFIDTETGESLPVRGNQEKYKKQLEKALKQK